MVLFIIFLVIKPGQVGIKQNQVHFLDTDKGGFSYEKIGKTRKLILICPPEKSDFIRFLSAVIRVKGPTHTRSSLLRLLPQERRGLVAQDRHGGHEAHGHDDAYGRQGHEQACAEERLVGHVERVGADDPAR